MTNKDLMTDTITEQQWKIYFTKYERLIYTIARKISGDEAIANVEDNFSDLCIAAINSIHSYKKKTGKEIDEFLETKLFDQYTKTVLWNYKAKKGVPLTNKMDFRNRHFSINAPLDEDGATFDIEDRSVSSFGSFSLNEMFEDQDDTLKKVLKAIMDDPSVVTDAGILKVSSLVGPTGLSKSTVDKAVDKIKRILGKNYGNAN